MARRGRKWKVKHGPCTYSGGAPKKGILRHTSRYGTEAREEDAREAPTEKPKKTGKPKKPNTSKAPMAATTTAEAARRRRRRRCSSARARRLAPLRPTAEASAASIREGLSKRQPSAAPSASASARAARCRPG